MILLHRSSEDDGWQTRMRTRAQAVLDDINIALPRLGAATFYATERGVVATYRDQAYTSVLLKYVSAEVIANLELGIVPTLPADMDVLEPDLLEPEETPQ